MERNIWIHRHRQLNLDKQIDSPRYLYTKMDGYRWIEKDEIGG